MRVLVVNGLFDEVRELRTQLGHRHEVWAASNGRSAETLCRSFRPDAVVLFLSDLNPDYKRLVGVFRGAGPAPCAVVAVAPFTHFKLIQQVLDWGVDAYLAGPCDMRRVRVRLEELVDHRNAREDDAAAANLGA